MSGELASDQAAETMEIIALGLQQIQPGLTKARALLDARQRLAAVVTPVFQQLQPLQDNLAVAEAAAERGADLIHHLVEWMMLHGPVSDRQILDKPEDVSLGEHVVSLLERTCEPTATDILRWREEEVGNARRYEEALAFYATPESYHAITIIADPPCGGFYSDFGVHGSPSYQEGDMRPGHTARVALRLVEPEAGFDPLQALDPPREE